MFSEPVNVNGHLVQAFGICKRQAWLLGHNVSADQSNDYLALGRLIDQNSYARERHQVAFGDNRFDFVQDADGDLVVCEVKKSSRAERSARLQLAHYLYDLRKAGIEARGVLMFPTEKKRVEVVLTDELMAELDATYDEIGALVRQDAPPAAASSKYCGKCAYAEYCWG